MKSSQRGRRALRLGPVCLLVAFAASAFISAGGCADGSGDSAGLSGDGDGAGGDGGSSSMSHMVASTSTNGQTSSTHTTTSTHTSTGPTTTTTATTSTSSGTTCTAPDGTPDFPVETELNDTIAEANVLADDAKGFVGQLCPLGDHDIFKVEVTDGATLSATVTGEDGTGCPAPNKLQLILLNDQSQAVVTDQHSTGTCPALVASKFPELTSLPAGTYYVEIRNLTTMPVQGYRIAISVALPFCGDNLAATAAGEQCDDGNMTDGDGCSADCQLEHGNYINEVEPNHDPATATLVDGFDGGVGSVAKAESDYYAVTVTEAGSSIIAQLSDGKGGCPKVTWSPQITLFSPTGASLQTDKNSSPTGCPEIAPATAAAATNLPVGVYAVRVKDATDMGTQAGYVLDLRAVAPGCGDTVIQGAEECDDGNTIAGDGCSPTCTLEGTFVDETEPNDTLPEANALGAADGFRAAISSSVDRDAFSFNITSPGQALLVTVDDGLGHCPTDFKARLRWFSPEGFVLADIVGAADPTMACVVLSPLTSVNASSVAAGTYKLLIEQENPSSVPKYVVHVRSVAVGCGDGIVQASEQCDDGNLLNGDGCSSTCMAEAPFEIEPNNTRQTATPQWPGSSSWIGSISPIGDIDYFKVVTTTSGKFTALTHNVGDVTTCSFDTKLTLYRDDGTVVVTDDNSGIGNCAKMTPLFYSQLQNLAAGTYYLAVQQKTGAAIIPRYQLDFTTPP